MMASNILSFVFFTLMLQLKESPVLGVNITEFVFGQNTNYLPAAFGDFNSDKLTDMFVLTTNGSTLKVLISHTESPLFREPEPGEGPSCTYQSLKIKSVVPGDFDGNGAMDVLIISLDVASSPALYNVFILWGSLANMTLECGSEDKPLLQLAGQPLVMDMNGDMIPDLFGEDKDHQRMFWIFSTERKQPMAVPLIGNGTVPGCAPLKAPSSHAFIDLTNDLAADLWVTAKECMEIWNTSIGVYQRIRKVDLPVETYMGQTSFADVNLDGSIEAIVPVCLSDESDFCKSSAIYVYEYDKDNWIQLNVSFKEDKSGNENLWKIAVTSQNKYSTETTTLRMGDFNLDGYPDFLVTLFDESSKPRVILMENVECNDACSYPRKFAADWDKFKSFGDTVLGTFFDFQEDGTLDILLLETTPEDDYQLRVFKDALEYDAVFVKVLIPTGRCYGEGCGLNNIAYGTNQPGPSITYSITTATGSTQRSKATQLSQSAHEALQLPYTVFGLGRNWNFVEVMKVGIPRGNTSDTLTSKFTQIIPNSQLIVIPYPMKDPDRWVSQLFITPSKAMLMTAGALIGTCLFVAVIIGILHHREKQEDKREKQQDAHKFHFDAM